jgi:hypothetical protein
VRGDVEIPSDLAGLLYKRRGPADSLSSIVIDLFRELKTASYDTDANRL